MSKLPRTLYKTTIVFWTVDDHSNLGPEEFTRLATTLFTKEKVYCPRMKSHPVENPTEDNDWGPRVKDVLDVPPRLVNG